MSRRSASPLPVGRCDRRRNPQAACGGSFSHLVEASYGTDRSGFDKLESQGLLSARSKSRTEPNRRVYAITDAGRAALSSMFSNRRDRIRSAAEFLFWRRSPSIFRSTSFAEPSKSRSNGWWRNSTSSTRPRPAFRWKRQPGSPNAGVPACSAAGLHLRTPRPARSSRRDRKLFITPHRISPRCGGIESQFHEAARFPSRRPRHSRRYRRVDVHR